MTKEDFAAEHKKLIDLLVRCIASTPSEYHHDLCMDFRIPPDLVAAAVTNGESK